MSIKIAGYEFQGPYSSPQSLQERAGVYVILTPTRNQYEVLDVGESANVRQRVENHDRKDCWVRHAGGRALYYAAHYTPHIQQPGRIAIERAIRSAVKPPCGDR